MSAFTPTTPVDRILVIRRDNIGDLVCTTPLIHALRMRFPRASLEVLANSYNGRVLEGHPDIDRLITYTKAKHAATNRLLAYGRELRVYWGLRARRYDLVVHANPSVHPRTENLVRALRPRHALGVSDDPAGAYDLRVDPSDVGGPHHVQQVFSILAPLGLGGEPPRLEIRGRHQRPPETPPLLGVQISSRRPANRWPPERFATVLERWLARGWRCKLFWAPGSSADPRFPGDDEQAAGVAAAVATQADACLDSTPGDSLEDLREGLARCDMVLTCDGGALHMAAALGRPTVALFGCTDPAVWGPWSVPSRSLHGQGEAGRIEVQDVLKALESLAGECGLPGVVPGAFRAGGGEHAHA